MLNSYCTFVEVTNFQARSYPALNDQFSCERILSVCFMTKLRFEQEVETKPRAKTILSFQFFEGHGKLECKLVFISQIGFCVVGILNFCQMHPILVYFNLT